MADEKYSLFERRNFNEGSLFINTFIFGRTDMVHDDVSCGLDSSVVRALHQHRRGHWFESRSEPDFFFFSVLCSNNVTAALALKTVNIKD